MLRKMLWSFPVALLGLSSMVAVPASASSFAISDSGCCSIDMSPVMVSAPITISNFDPLPPSWILGPSPSFYAVEFIFTVEDYSCDLCASPSNESIRFDGNLSVGGPGPGQSITGSSCGISIIGNGTYDTGICLVNVADVNAISAAFGVGGANILSIGFQGPANAPLVTFCDLATGCAATATFYQTKADVSAPEPASTGFVITGLGICTALYRRRVRR